MGYKANIYAWILITGNTYARRMTRDTKIQEKNQSGFILLISMVLLVYH